MKLLAQFADDCTGATSIEYGLIAALISVCMIAALNLISGNIGNTFTYLGNQLASATAN